MNNCKCKFIDILRYFWRKAVSLISLGHPYPLTAIVAVILVYILVTHQNTIPTLLEFTAKITNHWPLAALLIAIIYYKPISKKIDEIKIVDGEKKRIEFDKKRSNVEEAVEKKVSDIVDDISYGKNDSHNTMQSESITKQSYLNDIAMVFNTFQQSNSLASRNPTSAIERGWRNYDDGMQKLALNTTDDKQLCNNLSELRTRIADLKSVVLQSEIIVTRGDAEKFIDVCQRVYGQLALAIGRQHGIELGTDDPEFEEINAFLERIEKSLKNQATLDERRGLLYLRKTFNIPFDHPKKETILSTLPDGEYIKDNVAHIAEVVSRKKEQTIQSASRSGLKRLFTAAERYKEKYESVKCYLVVVVPMIMESDFDKATEVYKEDLLFETFIKVIPRFQ